MQSRGQVETVNRRHLRHSTAPKLSEIPNDQNCNGALAHDALAHDALAHGALANVLAMCGDLIRSVIQKGVSESA
jgi:hypothetical protein